MGSGFNLLTAGFLNSDFPSVGMESGFTLGFRFVPMPCPPC
jgi:hypothetical protein